MFGGLEIESVVFESDIYIFFFSLQHHLFFVGLWIIINYIKFIIVELYVCV